MGLSSATRANRYTVLELFLEIKQNTHDVYLLQAIIVFLGIGTLKPNFNIHDPVEIQEKRLTAKVIVRQTGQVIDFVTLYPMLTQKCLDFES